MYIFGYFFQKGHFKGYDPPVPLSPPRPPYSGGPEFSLSFATYSAE